MRSLRSIVAAAVLLSCGLVASRADADQVKVAVAANFTAPAKEIAAAFRRKTGNELVLSFGSSGQFYTQITQEAPFQVFLSADQARPEKLAGEGLAAPESRFTYAVGKLVLWSKQPGYVHGEATLRGAGFAKLSICNPAAAPYGEAAVEALKSLKLYAALKPKFVEGADIMQTFQFVATGNAEVGFVALSQLGGDVGGSRWLVPQTLYAPIRQDAILLKKGAGSDAAAAFMQFLKGPQARSIIEKYGYALDSGPR